MSWRCGTCTGHNPEGTKFCGHCGAPRAEESAPAPKADERRIVTALFADISGFTALADTLDAEEVHSIIGPIITRLAGIAEGLGGTIVKYAGDALLVFFGAPIAYEDHAVRALLVAGQMHAALDAMRPELPPGTAPLQLHIGVNTGEVVSGMFGGQAGADYSVLGDAVNVAQRLESAAPPGETYAGAMTERLARHRFTLEPVGDLALKGKAKPIAGWRVIRERSVARGASAPRTFGSAGFLVGRSDEMEEALTALRRIEDGHGALVSITGETGAGKSSLLQGIRDRALPMDGTWLETRCISYGASLAYWPFANLLRRAFRIPAEKPAEECANALADGLRAAGVSDALAFFAPLLGFTHAETPPDPVTYQKGLHKAFADWLSALAATEPLVVAIEDLHWADEPTIALATQLARLAQRLPVAFVLIARPEGAATIAEIASAAELPCTAISLRPLDAGALRELLANALDGEPPPGLVEAVHDRANGNPFFAEEILRSLLDGGLLARAGDRWRLESGWDAEAVPPTVEGVLAARIDLLPPQTANVLLVASVIGRQVLLPLLRELVPETTDLGAALEKLVATGFLDRVEGGDEEVLFFHHALVQEVAYARLLRKHRQEVHLTIAETGERLYGSGDDTIDLLARNLYLGGAGARAVDYLVRAGERARRLFANEASIVHLSRALELAPGDERTASRVPEITLALADLHELSGHYDDSLRMFTALRDETGDPRARRGIASTLRKRGEYARALASLDEAAEASGWSPELLLERAWTLAVEGRFAECVETAQRGLHVSKERSSVRASLLVQLARAEETLGSFDDALAHAVEAHAIFKDLKDLRGGSMVLRLMGAICLYAGDLDKASSSLRRGLEIARRVGNIEEVGGCLINLGLVEEKRGNYQEAARHARHAIEEFERIGHGAGRATGYSNLASALIGEGKDAEAAPHARTAYELAQTIGHTPIMADSLHTLASIHARLGEHATAADTAERAAALWSEVGEADRAAESYALAATSWEAAGDPIRANTARERAGAVDPPARSPAVEA